MTYTYRRGELDTPPIYAPYVFRPFHPEENASGWHWTPEARQAATTFNPDHCGTPKGYRQHRRHDQDACQPCKDAAAKASAEQRARKKGGR